MTLKNIKNIIFDMGGILLPITMERCFSAFAGIGFTRIHEFVNEYYKDGLFQDLELGNISIAHFCDAIRQYCSPGTTNEQIIDAWNLFVDPIPARKLDKILELRKSYRVYMLSNTNEIHWIQTCAKDFSRNGHCVADYFDKTYLSFEMHITKPDAGMFQQMLDDSGMVPGESLFIDDSRKNCDVARQLGICAHFAPVTDDWCAIFDE